METSQPSRGKPSVCAEQFAITGSPYLTTRVEGDMVRRQRTLSVRSAWLMTGGGTLREGDGGDGSSVGRGEGGEIWDGRGGADVEMETGDEVAEPTR